MPSIPLPKPTCADCGNVREEFDINPCPYCEAEKRGITEIKFFPISQFPPMRDGEWSPLLIVVGWEWNCPQEVAYCRAWKGKGQQPKFYLDREKHQLLNFREFGVIPRYFSVVSL